ncbi:longevity assurance proteins LAG1/LAC1 [Trichoderma citrinoviride]|uniref:Longevity assurance proteins LAG1/LAC1 n=1 Tax=Trichoderma citrinoviride TaxID=58853 RepID=A0A2T4BEV6_9HYPO|nr:longevity assurance proteins LAG1/LAC1 [Trichoderma citrinoviride]PTB67870.1 longevity assurance proteins LAG1/LAC1 [Trichoderma citrinoviride]
MTGVEPFPLLNTSADQLHSADVNVARRRRKSSGLGGEIRAGDTGAPALASSRVSLNAHDSETSKRRRARGFFSQLRQTMVKHTFALPAVLLLVFLAGYAINPSEANPFHHFLFLSYPLPQDDPLQPVQYGKGKWDIAFVAFYTIVLSFTREFIMQEVLRPMARRTGLSKGKQARLMEQMYTALYFGILGPAGMYVMSRTPVWYFNTRGMYEGFPHRSHEGVVKFYYLFQAAYWAQQAIVLLLGMEKPRKDFKELVGHHIVSLALIGLSYRFHFTYIGIAVYITHDISDFFLASSKALNYIDHPIVAPYFATFVAVWIYMRHYINLRIIWSLFTEFRTVGPFELNWETQQYKCWISQYITSALLASLQALNLFWLFYILRIAYRFIRDKEATDDRSEDEDDEETEKPKHNGKKAVPQLQVHYEDLNEDKHNGSAKH